MEKIVFINHGAKVKEQEEIDGIWERIRREGHEQLKKNLAVWFYVCCV